MTAQGDFIRGKTGEVFKIHKVYSKIPPTLIDESGIWVRESDYKEFWPDLEIGAWIGENETIDFTKKSKVMDYGRISEIEYQPAKK